jgi:hypothetical protein
MTNLVSSGNGTFMETMAKRGTPEELRAEFDAAYRKALASDEYTVMTIATITLRVIEAVSGFTLPRKVAVEVLNLVPGAVQHLAEEEDEKLAAAAGPEVA